MFAKINFHDEFYQKLKLLVLPITMQQFMLALVSATDAIMLGAVSQTSLSAVSLGGQIQFVLNLFMSGISSGSGIMAAQYWGKKDAASIEEVMPIALRTTLIFSGAFTVFAAVAELEREYILQRQREGIAIAKRQGKYRGRPPKAYPDFERIAARWQKGEITAVQAMKQLGMSKTRFYERVKRLKK